MDVYLSPEEGVLSRDASDHRSDDVPVQGEAQRVEMAEVTSTLNGMAVSLLMGLAVWLVIIIVIVAMI